MKKLILILTVGFALTSNAQDFYAFSKVTGSSYFSLSGATTLYNNNWTDFTKGVKLPFGIKFWGDDLTDSVFVDDLGTISVDEDYLNNISFLGDDLKSRGAGKTSVNYMVSGSAPDRILKVEFKNVGFQSDASLKDSASFQCWIYEKSNIIEFRYGPNSVKSTTWKKKGAIVGLSTQGSSKFIALGGNPLNPTIYHSGSTPESLDGMPINGTIYKFTPSTSGIKEAEVQIKIIDNKISLPASAEVKSIQVYNSTGQIVQSSSTVEETNLSGLNHGIYFIVINTATGVISEKKFL